MTGGANPLPGGRGRINVLSAWSLVQGFAKLRIEAAPVQDYPLPERRQEEADIQEILDRAAVRTRPK